MMLLIGKQQIQVNCEPNRELWKKKKTVRGPAMV